MSPQAVTTRLRDMSHQFEARGFIQKGIDMSSPALTARLRTLAALSDMCSRLLPVGRTLSPPARNRGDRGRD